MKFPYHRYEIESSPTLPEGVIYRPMVRIRAIGVAGDASFFALVDTGADETLLPQSIVDIIGAPIKEKGSWNVSGLAGQEVQVKLGEVNLELTDSRRTFHWKTAVGFVAFPTPEDEIAILGHAGFLNFFRLKCDVERREIDLQPNSLFKQQRRHRL